jgi:hypothetical protein
LNPLLVVSSHRWLLFDASEMPFVDTADCNLRYAGRIKTVESRPTSALSSSL